MRATANPCKDGTLIGHFEQAFSSEMRRMQDDRLRRISIANGEAAMQEPIKNRLAQYPRASEIRPIIQFGAATI